MRQGFTLWFTGLPDSGKTTLARHLAQALTEKGFDMEVLDGNELRDGLSPKLGFSREEREDHNRRVGYLARMLNRHGVVSIVAVIAPYANLRREIREKTKDYIEVYLECPREVLVARDTKGLYQKALAGKIKNFTGVDDPYEIPENPELVLRTDRKSEQECLEEVLLLLERQGYISPASGYTPEEEAKVRKHLESLSYI
jgi:adenylyl-sulfate kinase